MSGKITLGPATLIAAAFVGPGTVTVCAQAGIGFGYGLLWALLLSTFVTILFQEMAARIGIITQKGLATVIREHIQLPTLRWGITALILAAILLGNTAYEAGNLNGAVLGLNAIFGDDYMPFYPWLIGGVAMALLYFGSIKALQKILIGMVLLMSISFVITALITGPPFWELLKGLFVPNPNSANVLTIVALLGTTVVPYNLFLHTSLAANQWNKENGLQASKRDTIIAVGLGGLVSMAILITAAALPIDKLNSVMDIAAGVEPLFGSYASVLMGLGLLGAGLTSALTAPLAAAFVFQNCMGWKSDTNDWKFKGVAIVILLLGTVSLATSFKPIDIIIFAQAANGILLPILAILIVIMAASKSLLGEHRNSKRQNILGGIVILLSLVLSIKTLSTLFF